MPKYQSKEYRFKCPKCELVFYSGTKDKNLTCVCGYQLLKGTYNLWKQLLFKLSSRSYSKP